MDLDLVHRNGVWKVEDEDEFESNAVKLCYPAELIQKARQELANLQKIIETKQFPFDGTLESFIKYVPNGKSTRYKP